MCVWVGTVLLLCVFLSCQFKLDGKKLSSSEKKVQYACVSLYSCMSCLELYEFSIHFFLYTFLSITVCGRDFVY